jgi:hypothetical protein
MELSMFIHAMNIAKMALGIILVFFAVILWSTFRKFTSALLALTALFIYASVVLDLLEFYAILTLETILVYRGTPLLKYIPTFFVLLSFIVTFIVFFREEKKSRENA